MYCKYLKIHGCKLLSGVHFIWKIFFYILGNISFKNSLKTDPIFYFNIISFLKFKICNFLFCFIYDIYTGTVQMKFQKRSVQFEKIKLISTIYRWKWLIWVVNFHSKKKDLFSFYILICFFQQQLFCWKLLLVHLYFWTGWS